MFLTEGLHDDHTCVQYPSHFFVSIHLLIGQYRFGLSRVVWCDIAVTNVWACGQDMTFSMTACRGGQIRLCYHMETWHTCSVTG